ncbi:MAG: Sugar fermentation stimulation protein A [Syntrophorhabdaceae bacterium PtaU1.Bin034]|nr:MAG: Sugar fermentation stimulation protein A [Syntrophorhabdaceae bacterium PtaU1.Bin034]
MRTIFRPFRDVVQARFISRPNRFLVECELDGGLSVNAFLPNPGRLQELLLPGAVIHLVRDEQQAGRKTVYTAVGVNRDEWPVMLHTHKTNVAARHLLENRLIPGLEDATVLRQEVPAGHSRFDFLLRDREGEMLLEVKSCTLFGNTVAMFPDAVTARGARHLRDLAEHSGNGMRSAVLFMVHWPFAQTFMPDYHTDLSFARTLLAVRKSVRIIPVAVQWQQGLALGDKVSILDIPWAYIEQEAQDRGSYLLILKLKEDSSIPVGTGRFHSFRKGFYLYVGSAMANLTARIERHCRSRKRYHWHIDWLRSVADVHAVLPVRSSTRLECSLAEALSGVAEWFVPGFGCSDCSCDTHLFGMTGDPLNSREFHRVLQHFRMDRYSVGKI